MSLGSSVPVVPLAGSRPLPAPSAWRTGALSAAVAAVANSVVLVAARALGADMLVRHETGETAMTVGIGTVETLTVVPVLLATLLLLALRRWGPRAWRALAVAGLVVALTTAVAPFTVLAETPTRVALALMHVVAGAAWCTAVRRAAGAWER